MFQRLLLLCCVTALAACSAGPSNTAPTVQGSAGPSNTAPTVQGRWWSWAASTPSGSNPIEDKTGEFCDRNQPVDVWFLAGTFGGHANRQCQIPDGRRIEAPVINLYSGDPQDCDEFMQTAEGSAKLDGTELPLDRIDMEAITFTAAQDNVMGERPGTFKATGCGLWVHIDSLALGSHSLQIRGRSGTFAVSVDYTLEIVR